MTTTIAIACQGGALQTAFTAGVLKTILRAQPKKDFEIIALSGTSAGALCALMVWYGLAQPGGNPELAEQALDGLWYDFGAQRPQEEIFNAWVVNAIRAQDTGLVPNFKVTPYLPFLDLTIVQLEAAGLRPEFVDYETLLEKNVDFSAVDQARTIPRLLVGAISVLSGEFKAFDSFRGEISSAAIRASGALPWLGTKAVTIDDQVYWDGLLSQNPPIKNFFVAPLGDQPMPINDKPDEIWVIRINPQTREQEPRSVSEIEDRRNELTGNLSLNQELDFIKKVNEWLADGSLSTNRYKPIALHRIEMNESLSSSLDTASKLDRSQRSIEKLMTDGQQQGQAFIDKWQPERLEPPFRG